MADELAPEKAFEALRWHLDHLPEGMDPRRRQEPINTGDTKVVESIRDWLSELDRLLRACGAWIKNPVAGRGLDSLWLRKLAAYVAGIDAERRQASDLANFLFHTDDIGYGLQPYGLAGCYIAKFRASGTPGGIASLLEDDEPDLLSQLRSLSEKYEQRWLDSGLPPRHDAGGGLFKTTSHTTAQNTLIKTIDDFERDCGAVLLRAVDELRIPSDLRKLPEFVDVLFRQLRNGVTDGRGVFQWLCQQWLPSVATGYGGVGYDYPGADRDDAERLNEGVRRARCAKALAETLTNKPKQPTHGSLSDPTFDNPISTSPVGSMATGILIDEWFALYGSLFFWGAWEGDATEGLVVRRQAGLMRFKSVTEELADRGEGMEVDATDLYRIAGMLHSVGDHGEVLTVPDSLKDDVHAVAKRIRARDKANQQESFVTFSGDTLAAQIGGSNKNDWLSRPATPTPAASEGNVSAAESDASLLVTSLRRVRK